MNTRLTSFRTDPAELGFLLDNLLNNIKGAVSAVVTSADGLLVAASSNLVRDDAERLSAVISGLYSCCAGASGVVHGGGVVRNILEMQTGWLFVSDIAEQARLAVHTGAAIALGDVTYQMESAVPKIGQMMDVEARSNVVHENG